MRKREIEIVRLSTVDDKISYALFLLFEFFKLYDYIEKTNHEKIVKKLYDEHSVKSLIEICRETHIDEKTLFRYRQKYLIVYEVIVANISINC